jgi:hypothetical protein
MVQDYLFNDSFLVFNDKFVTLARRQDFDSLLIFNQEFSNSFLFIFRFAHGIEFNYNYERVRHFAIKDLFK